MWPFSPASADTHYVSLTGNHVSPFTNWVDAATNIQAAVDVASSNDTVLVTNGVYQPTTISTPITVESVAGPAHTAIDGGGLMRCVTMSNRAKLTGFAITNGYADSGGGVLCSTNEVLVDCVLAGNFAANSGGGIRGGFLVNCVLSGNTADGWWGGGAADAVLRNCVIRGNRANEGGGVGGMIQGCDLANCLVLENHGNVAGGAYGGTLNNCTIVGNIADVDAGGTSMATLNNCIVYYNVSTGSANDNYYRGSYRNCCTTPSFGTNCIVAEPEILTLNNPRLRPGSPCIDAGDPSRVIWPTDGEGESRENGVVDVGWDEYWASGLTGDVVVAISVSATQAVTAAELLFEANVSNRVLVARSLRVHSVNGPEVTEIHGSPAAGGIPVRCAWLSDGATLEGFTLANGHTHGSGWIERRRGGGAFCASYRSVIENCVIMGCVADLGGGVYGGSLRSCLLHHNTIDSGSGGGAFGSRLENCTVASNRRGNDPAGIQGVVARNCIIYDNNYLDSVLEHSCATPLPPGPGNITNAPRFVDVSSSNYHLRALSPCVDIGLNDVWMFATDDVDGNPRVFNGIVDLGAYEFTMHTAAKTLLSGVYSTNSHTMATTLQQAGRVPPTAVYVGDRRARTALPSNTTDWVLLQLLETNDLTSVAAKSVFLRSDGQVVNDDGSTGIRLECSPGYYYLVAKHRNHVAVMSAQPLAYTNELITYDFTTNWTQYRGGTNACVELEPGVWGMIAGDADGDGKITHVDRKICEEQQGQTGYKAGDFNLDGVVDGRD